jgi:hypothetical protein
VLRFSEGNFAEFQCLSAIQYHCKYEYLTYFLYNDLKVSFQKVHRFREQLSLELGKYGTSLPQLQQTLSAKAGQHLDSFITDYHSSVGANLVPISAYAKVLTALFKRGPLTLVRLLASFSVNHRSELEHGLSLLSIGQQQEYTQFMR